MATIIRNNIIKRYKVSGESTRVMLSGVIGYGHPSVSTVYLDGNKFDEFTTGNWSCDLGICKELKGKKIESIVTVSVMQPNPNTSIDWEVSGCGSAVLNAGDTFPGTKGDLISYTLTVYFI